MLEVKLLFLETSQSFEDVQEEVNDLPWTGHSVENHLELDEVDFKVDVNRELLFGHLQLGQRQEEVFFVKLDFLEMLFGLPELFEGLEGKPFPDEFEALFVFEEIYLLEELVLEILSN